MTRYRVDRKAVEKAQALIDSHPYVLDSDWSEAPADTDAENDYLDRHGWDEFSQWFLAVDVDASEATKSRFGFDYGDFRRVHRSGLIAAKQRAAQNGHDEVESAADTLLSYLDQTHE